MRPRVVLGIQARTGSKRLPRKVLADLAGEPLILRVVERARSAFLVDEVVVLTSVEESDDELAALLVARDVPVRRGPLADVLARYLALGEEYEPDFVVRVTGDCPLIEPGFIDRQLGALCALDADFVTVAGNEDGAYDGALGGQTALSLRALRRAASSADERDREHVGSFYFRSRAEEFRVAEVAVDDGYRWPGLRLSVDEPQDLELARGIYAHFADAEFTALEALAWLRERPDVRSLNAAVRESADNEACRRLSRESRHDVVGRWP